MLAMKSYSLFGFCCLKSRQVQEQLCRPFAPRTTESQCRRHRRVHSRGPFSTWW